MIRLAEAADAAGIGALWAQMVDYHAQFDAVAFRAAENGAARYAQSISDRLRDPQARVLVVELDGELVGYASGLIADMTTDMFLPLRCGFLSDMFVSEAYQRRGWGRRLVERLALWFRDQGVDYFEWHVSAQNQAALAFWRDIGGEVTILRMRARLPDGNNEGNNEEGA